MPEFFESPSGARKQEKIPYPDQPLTQDQLMSEEALTCWLYVAHVTKLSLRDLISEMLLDAYDITGETLIASCERRDEWLENHPGATEKDYRKLQRHRSEEKYSSKSFKQRIRKANPSGSDWIGQMGVSLD